MKNQFKINYVYYAPPNKLKYNIFIMFSTISINYQERDRPMYGSIGETTAMSTEATATTLNNLLPSLATKPNNIRFTHLSHTQTQTKNLK